MQEQAESRDGADEHPQGSSLENPNPPFDVVALVASVGGLDAFGTVLRDLPADFPAAVLVAQHLGAQSGLSPFSSGNPMDAAVLLGVRDLVPLVGKAVRESFLPVRKGSTTRVDGREVKYTRSRVAGPYPLSLIFTVTARATR